MKTSGLTQSVSTRANANCINARYDTHQMFFPLPYSSLQHSWPLEFHFHKTKCRHGFCQISGRLDVLDLKQTPRHSAVSAPLIRGSTVSHGTVYTGRRVLQKVCFAQRHHSTPSSARVIQIFSMDSASYRNRGSQALKWDFVQIYLLRRQGR